MTARANIDISTRNHDPRPRRVVSRPSVSSGRARRDVGARLKCGALALLVGLTASQASATVIVLPLLGPTDPEVSWVGEAVAAALPAALGRAGLPVLTHWERLELLAAMGIPTGPVSRATAIRVGEAAELDHAVVGTFEITGSRLAVSVRVLDVAGARLGPALRRSAELASLQALIEELAWDIAARPPFRASVMREAYDGSRREIAFSALRAHAHGLVRADPNERARLFVEALREDPRCHEARLALAHMQLDAEKPEAALQVLQGLGESSRVARSALFLQGVALLDLERFSDAASTFARIARAQQSATALANQAIALLRAPRRDVKHVKASALLRDACELGEHHPDLVFNLAWALLLEGEPAASAFWMRGLIMDDPDDLQARVVLSWGLREAGRTREADEEWRGVVARAPAYASLQATQPSRRFERPLRSQRLLFLGVARRSHARLATAHLERGGRLLDLGDPAAAMAELTQAAYLNPYDDRIHRELARAHSIVGDADGAIKELRMAVWCRDSASTRVQLAEILAARGDTAQARDEARAALALDPGNQAARRLAGP